MSSADISPLLLTLKLAVISTAFLLVLGTPLAWWLAQTQARIKIVIDALITLPLVLPPTVLGFYLLLFLSSDFLGSIGIGSLAFTFSGLVIGSIIYSLPFVVQPLQVAFSAIPQNTLDAAATLRASPLDRFFSIVIPQARGGYFTALILGFAHTLGEFGVVLMIGGSIPGKTKVLSIAIYEHVEALDYGHAHGLSACLLLMSFTTLLLVYAFNRRFKLIRS